MAHRLLQLENNEYAMTSVQRPGVAADIPWHKLGTAMTEEEAHDPRLVAIKAGLDWYAGLAKMFIAIKDGQRIECPNMRAVTRTDTFQVLGYGTEGYKIIQPNELLETPLNWLQDGRAFYETAGQFEDGSIWALLNIGRDFFVGGIDKIVPYVLLRNSYDGGSKLRMKPVFTRVVCGNTEDVAMSETAHETYGIRHTTNALERLQDADKALGLISRSTVNFKEKMEQLANAPADTECIERAFKLVVPDAPVDAPYKIVLKTKAEREELFKLYATSPTVDRGTRYGVFNAVTQFIDHEQRRKGQNADSTNTDSLERRALYSLEGAGATLRQTVYNQLMAGVR